MRPFGLERPDTPERATGIMAARQDRAVPPPLSAAQFIAGGTNMADYMKLGVARPELLVDINRLTDPGLRQIVADDKGLRFGALVRMSEAERDEAVTRDYPVIAESLKLAASPQIRNMASLGGNVLQRTRCEYFRDTSWACNKRNPGSGCAAMDGFNRQHAVLGTSDKCIATYHGDFAQALIALDASVETQSPGGGRTLAFSELHRLPGDTPHVETQLTADELIAFIHVPAKPWARRSRYLKIRDRQSYAFALASAAVVLDMEGDIVRDVRIALGGLATVPWRAREAEDELRGRPLDEAAAERAAEAAFADARPREHNGFKVALGRRTLVRALLETRDMKVPP
ncbi:MAG: FAD binding domain-containing protein [Rhizobiaceae bacterium]